MTCANGLGEDGSESMFVKPITANPLLRPQLRCFWHLSSPHYPPSTVDLPPLLRTKYIQNAMPFPVAYFLASCANCTRRFSICFGGEMRDSRTAHRSRVLKALPIVEYVTVFIGFILAIMPSLFAFFSYYCCLSPIVIIAVSVFLLVLLSLLFWCFSFCCVYFSLTMSELRFLPCFNGPRSVNLTVSCSFL